MSCFVRTGPCPVRAGWGGPGLLEPANDEAEEMASYKSFKELCQHEVEGRDYRIRMERRDPRILIMAPHGGRIEPTTATIAERIAGDDYSFYCFEGLKAEGNRVLHLESHLFDEPEALEAVERAEVVITVHGQRDPKEERVMMGGLHSGLRLEIERQLGAAGFQSRPAPEGLTGRDPLNICNRGKSGEGVQLEVSRRVRDCLRDDRGRLRLFAEAVRRAIEAGGW